MQYLIIVLVMYKKRLEKVKELKIISKAFFDCIKAQYMITYKL